MSAVFITGTGTDVGKTFVASGLIHCMRERNQPVGALKPLVSGFDPAAPSRSDPAVLLQALGREVKPKEIQRVSPWRFRAPLSPDMAALAEGRAIDFEEVIDFCRSAIRENSGGALIIEGIGGIMVPIDKRHTLLDVMAALRLPLILVAGSYLGTLSHVLCAQEVILRRALALCAIVVSETDNSPVPLDTILASLGHFTNAPLLGLKRQGQNEKVFQELVRLMGDPIRV